jgi:hypothetical protein
MGFGSAEIHCSQISFKAMMLIKNYTVFPLECDISMSLCVPGINSRHMAVHPG